jgi:hypothetical protein
MVSNGSNSAATLPSAKAAPTKSSSVFSVSFGATVLMGLYVAFAMLNLYNLMFPLQMLDLSKFQYPRDFVHPLWTKDESTSLHLRVYLSTQPRFSLNFLDAQDFASNRADDDINDDMTIKSKFLLPPRHIYYCWTRS